MISLLSFSDTSIQRLQNRDLSSDEISAFEHILQQFKQSDTAATDYLKQLSSSDLALVQKANSMANPIAVHTLSKEGAQNLLSQPDGSDLVDLDNNGIVEIGEAKTLHFPPVNAPAYVHQAWEQATQGLSEFDKATLELTMHFAIYGVPIDGVNTTTPLSAEEQWSASGRADLFDKLYSNLEFRVGMEGWTDYNVMLQGVYQQFESAMQRMAGASFQTPSLLASETGSAIGDDEPVNNSQTDNVDSTAPTEQTERQRTINQLLLDARLGIDREKLKEIDEKMEDVKNDTSLTSDEMQKKLQALQAAKEALIKEAQERSVATYIYKYNSLAATHSDR